MNLNTISTDELYKLSEQNPIIIDVRTPEEYSEGHIIGAKSFPLSEISNDDIIKEINDLRDNIELPIYVTCATSRRSAMACALLIEANISNLILVEGGTKGWVESGFPIE